MFKLPEDMTKYIRNYKKGNVEERKEFEEDFIKKAREESPLMNQISDEQIIYWLRRTVSLINTKEE